MILKNCLTVLLSLTLSVAAMAGGGDEWRADAQRQNVCRKSDPVCVLSVNSCIREGSEGFGLYFDLFVLYAPLQGHHRRSYPADPSTRVSLWPNGREATRQGRVVLRKEVLLPGLPEALQRQTVASSVIHAGYPELLPQVWKASPATILHLLSRYTGATDGVAAVSQVFVPLARPEVGKMVGRRSLLRLTMMATPFGPQAFYGNLFVVPQEQDLCGGLVSD